MKRVEFIFFLFFLIFKNSFSEDTLVVSKFQFYKIDNSLKIIDFGPDTIGELLQKDISFNSINVPISTTGNISSPIFYLTPNALFHSGFDFLPDYFSENFPKSKYSYYSNKAFTSLKFALGSKKEQDVSFFHTQNFGKGLNFYARSQNFRSGGFYRNQTTRSNFFELGYSSFMLKKKLFSTGNLSFGRNGVRENGGLPDTIEIDRTQEKSLYDVNILQASSNRSKYNLELKTFYFLNSDYLAKDSIEQCFYLFHSINISEIKRYYKDSLATDFYNQANYSLVNSTDFIYNRRIDNELGFVARKSRSIFKLGLVSHLNYLNSYFNKLTNNGLEINSNFSNQSILGALNLDARYFIGAWNNGDKTISLNFRPELKFSNLSFLLAANYNRVSPYVYYNSYYSNRNNWINKFGKETFSSIELNLLFRKIFDLSIENYLLKNLVIIGDDYSPKQLQSSIKYGTIKLGLKLKFNLLHSHSYIVLQKKFGNSFDLNFPSIYFKEQLRIDYFSFKRNLKNSIGFDFIYSPKTYGWGYLPSIGSFYHQSNFLVMGYPKLDFVYGFYVKNLEGYFRVDNLTSSFSKELFFTAKDYPMPDRTIRLGIIWTFVDEKAKK